MLAKKEPPPKPLPKPAGGTLSRYPNAALVAAMAEAASNSDPDGLDEVRENAPPEGKTSTTTLDRRKR